MCKSEITLGDTQYIKVLEKVNIKNTNDSIIITKELKKTDIPEGDDTLTVSFSYNIPYTITVDGVEYEDFYILGQNSHDDNTNPKYEIANRRRAIICNSHAAINIGEYNKPIKAHVIIKSIGLFRFILIFFFWFYLDRGLVITK